ncbi:MAG TPA: hypothetical protein PKC83_12915 [Gemmatimonadaceae bacterium]|nr:hypothetical protein [Gemmatimonadaceae bacterium]
MKGSKKSAASPTSAAPGAQARRARTLKGPVARGVVRRVAPANRSASCGRPAIHRSRKAAGSPAIVPPSSAGTTTATFVTPAPTSASPV